MSKLTLHKHTGKPAKGGPDTQRGEMTSFARMTMSPVQTRVASCSHERRDLKERVKELNCLFEFSNLFAQDASVEVLLRKIVELIPPACLYPEITGAAIVLQDFRCTTKTYRENKSAFEVPIYVHGHRLGRLSIVVCHQSLPTERVLLAEEKRLLADIAERLGRVIERRRTEQELRIKNRAVASSLTGIILTSPDGLVTYANEMALKLWRCESESILYTAIDKLWQDENHGTAIRSALNSHGQWSGELDAKRSDGSVFSAHAVVSLVLDDDGSVLGQNWSVADITERLRQQKEFENSRRELARRFEERTARLTRINDQLIDQLVARKRAERALRLSEQRYRLLLEQTDALICHCDDKGDVTLANHRFAQDCDKRVDQIIGQNIRELYVPEEADLLMERVQDALQTKHAVVYEYRVIRNDQERWFSATIHPISDSTSHSYGIWIINRDITQRKEATERLKQVNEQLRAVRHALTEKNMALTAIMDQIDDRANKVAAQIESNIQRIVIPLVDKLAIKVSEPHNEYVQMIRTQLSDITSPFIHTLERHFARLTPREVEICLMIRNGLSCKQIGEHLNTSERTVLKHRQNIRSKLGIAQTKTNLTTYLRQMDSLHRD